MQLQHDRLPKLYAPTSQAVINAFNETRSPTQWYALLALPLNVTRGNDYRGSTLRKKMVLLSWGKHPSLQSSSSLQAPLRGRVETTYQLDCMLLCLHLRPL